MKLLLTVGFTISFCLLIAGFLLRKHNIKKYLFSAALIILCLSLLEIACATALRIRQGAWIYSKKPNYNFMLFEPDERLVGIPRKNIDVTVNGIRYRHNSDHYRGNEFERLKTGKRILCIGGSTTYGIGANNHETWSYYLDSLLNNEYEVLNLGIPGHNSVEHKILLPQVIEKYDPDAVIFHVGLNDLRCMNVEHLAADYENFHRPTLYGSFGFCLQDRLPRSGLLVGGLIALRKINLVSPCPFHGADFSGTVSDTVDMRVVNIFRNNLDTLTWICSERNIPVILIPQMLSVDLITENNYKWWAPYLTKNGLFHALDTMNLELRKKSNEENIFYVSIEGIGHVDYFYDASHLNHQGNLKLALLLRGSGYF